MTMAATLRDVPPMDHVTTWDDAQPGRTIADGLIPGAYYRVVARKIGRKAKARELAASFPNGRVWLDGPRHWAVLEYVSPR